jgi:hypothetical protein
VFLFSRLKNFLSKKSFKVYHQVDLIIPFRDIMVVEKHQNSSSISDSDIQSALVITTKNQVKIKKNYFF